MLILKSKYQEAVQSIEERNLSVFAMSSTNTIRLSTIILRENIQKKPRIFFKVANKYVKD